MTDENKIVWADELWVPPSSMRWINEGHIVATQLSLRFIEGEFTHPLYSHPPQRTWVGLTDDEIDQGLLRTNYAMQTAKAWRDGVAWAYHQLKEKA